MGKNFLPSRRTFTRFVFYRSLLENNTRYGLEGEETFLEAGDYLREIKNSDQQIQGFENALALLKKIIDNEKRKEYFSDFFD